VPFTVIHSLRITRWTVKGLIGLIWFVVLRCFTRKHKCCYFEYFDCQMSACLDMYTLQCLTVAVTNRAKLFLAEFAMSKYRTAQNNQ
jgi:hypothetical protein